MPRLRNVSTGAIVNVSDATAALLGSEWQKPEPRKTAPKPTEKPAVNK